MPGSETTGDSSDGPRPLFAEGFRARFLGGPSDRPDGDSKGDDGNVVLTLRSEALRGALTRYFARQISDPAEIDDLIQDVFLRVVRRGGVDAIERLDGYIFETAASVLKDRYRSRKVRQSDRHVTFEPDAHSGSVPGPDREVIGRDSLRAAVVALMELPERTRQVFVLRRMEALSYREIATRLGLSVSAVEKHMLRATRHLIARTGGPR